MTINLRLTSSRSNDGRDIVLQEATELSLIFGSLTHAIHGGVHLQRLDDHETDAKITLAFSCTRLVKVVFGVQRTNLSPAPRCWGESGWSQSGAVSIIVVGFDLLGRTAD